MGPSVMTPASKVIPGILVQTADVRSNEEGVLGHPMKDLRNVRLRLRQVQLVELLPLNGD